MSGPNGVWSDTAVYRPLLLQQTTTRGTHAWTTNFSYHTGLGTINDYGNAYLIEEVGESIYQWRKTTRTFQSGFTPYLLGVVASVTVEQNSAFGQHDGSTSSSSIYNLTTGFLESQTVRGMTTTFEPRTDGNVLAANAVFDDQPSRTVFTYDWGQVSSVQTPKVTTTSSSPGGLSPDAGGCDDHLTAMRLRDTPPRRARVHAGRSGSWLRINQDRRLAPGRRVRARVEPQVGVHVSRSATRAAG